MSRSQSFARLPFVMSNKVGREVLKELVFLTQTDTTIGFVSQDPDRLTAVKQRPSCKYYIKALNTLHTLKTFTRVPSCHKKRVRRANKTTYIMPNGDSYRVVKEKHHLLLLNRLKWAYTTSANLSGQSYDETFAKEVADVIIEPLKKANTPSSIFKLGKNQIKRVR